MVAATVLLMAPPLLMVTAPRALVAVAPLIERIPLTLVVPLVKARVLVARVPVLMFKPVTVVAAPRVTVLVELILKL